MSDLATIADAADALTNPMRIVEPLWDRDKVHRNKRMRRVWIVTLPSLLDQLAEAVIPGESYTEDEAYRSAFASRPAARLDAVDRLLAIEAGAAMWCVEVKLGLRPTTAENIRGLVGKVPVLTSDQVSRLGSDMHAWNVWAAVVTGWDKPAEAPRAPCMNCERVGSLRVRYDRETGCCLACGAAWDSTNLALLAAHVAQYGSKTAVDAEALRTEAVLARRTADARLPHDHIRPDLPYVS